MPRPRSQPSDLNKPQVEKEELPEAKLSSVSIKKPKESEVVPK